MEITKKGKYLLLFLKCTFSIFFAFLLVIIKGIFKIPKSAFELEILILIGGIIMFIFKNPPDIITIVTGIIFIITEKLFKDIEGNILIIYLFILMPIAVLDLVRLIIFKKYKGTKFIKKWEDIEFLHYIVYKLLRRTTKIFY